MGKTKRPIYFIMYNYFYRFGQNLISKILYTKEDFKIDIAKLLLKSNFEEIHDIGGSDGILLNYIDFKKYNYFCYDVDKHNVQKSSKKYKRYKNISFLNQSIEEIKVNNKKKKLFLFVGVFHHLKDSQIKKFLSKLSSKDSIIAIDPFYHKNQNFFSIFLKLLDRGKYIRNYEGYKKILIKFKFKKRINYYLKFYSHLVSYRNIGNNLIKIIIS